MASCSKLFAADARLYGMAIPAFVTLVCYIVISMLILSPIDLQLASNKETDTTYHFCKRLRIVFLMALPAYFYIRTINCIVIGNCMRGSWVQAVLISVWTLLLVAVTLSVWIGYPLKIGPLQIFMDRIAPPGSSTF